MVKFNMNGLIWKRSLYSYYILVLFFPIQQSYAVDRKLSHLFSLMGNNEEVFVVFDPKFNPLNLGENTEMSKDFGGKLELGFTAFKILSDTTSVGGNIEKFSVYSRESQRNSNGNENSAKAVKIIGNLQDVNDTIRLISQIGDSRNGLQNVLKHSWFLILWPERAGNASKTARESVLFQNLNTTTFIESFSVSSHLYFGFYNESQTNLTNPRIEDVNEFFQFFEAYGVAGKLVVKQVKGIGRAYLDCSRCPSFTSRRSDLQGTLLRVVGLEDPEFIQDTVYKYNATSGDVEFVDGFSVKLFFILQQALNFTYKGSLVTPKDSRAMGEVSAWDGTVKRVQEGDADYGLSLTVQLQNRAKRVYFLPPTDEYKVSAFFHPPSSQAIRDIFMQPFHIDLWAAVVSTWLVLAFSMILFSKIRQRIGAGEPGVEEPDFTQSSFIWALATACQQGWDEHPVSGSMRTIFISGSFTGVVAYAGYSAAIVSTLSLRVDPIRTPQALIDSHLKIGMRSGFLDFILSYNQTEDIVSKVYRRLDGSTKGSLNVSEGYELLSKKPFAFVSIQDTFYDVVTQSLSDKQICDIRELTVLKQGFPAGSFLSHNSQYKDFFRIVIIKTRERGVLWRLRGFFMYTRRCEQSADNQGQALGANDVFTAFMILLAGYVTSIAFLFIEKMVFIKKLMYVQ